MRIISDYHDYYDSVQKMGQDQSILYLRKRIDFKQNELDSIESDKLKFVLKTINIFSKAHIRSFREISIRGYYGRYGMYIKTDKGSFHSSYHLFFFCGKVYPVILLQTIGEPKSEKYVWLYNQLHIELFLREYKVFEQKNYIKNIYHGYQKDVDNQIYRFQQWFLYEPKFDNDWFIENKVISLLFGIRDSYYASESNIITINPCLQDIEFFKVMDAYTAYQELDMFISGTLSYPQNSMVEVSDEQKVLKHGFDPKYGFRKRKSEV